MNSTAVSRIYLPDIRALIARTASSFKDHYFSLVAHRRRWKPGEPYCSRAQPSLSLPSPLFVRLPNNVSFSLLYSRVNAYSLSFPVSLLAIFHASTGWHVRRRILRNSMEIARVPDTALERISRHRVSQRRTPRLDIPIRYTAGTWGAHCETHRNRGRDRPRANDRASERKRKRDSFGG